MQCPLCVDSPLEPKYVGATEVDICPKCRGIWLDRGELDRLVGEAPARDERRDESLRADDRSFDDRSFDDRRGGGDRGGGHRGGGFRGDERGYDDRRGDERTPRGKKSKAKRLADLFEEVLDF